MKYINTILFFLLFSIISKTCKSQNRYSVLFIDSSKSILKKAVVTNNKNLLIKNCMGIADAFLYQGKSDSSLKYLNMIQASEIKNPVLNFEYYWQFGKTNSAKALYFSALQYAFKSLFFAEQINDRIYKAKSYTLIANINGLLNNNSEALTWHSKALIIYKQRQLFDKQYLTINNMGNCYKRLSNYSKAIELYKDVLVYKLKKKDLFWQGVAYTNLGDTYLKKKDYKSAIFFTKNALEIDLLQKDTMSIFMGEVQMAEAFDKFGNIEQSLLFAKKAEVISRNLDMVDEKIILFDLLSRIYNRKKNHVQAFDYLQKSNIMKQNKYENELEKKISAQKADYDLLNEKQKSENQKNTITLQTKNNNNLRIASILLIGLLITIFFFYQNQKKQNKIIKVQTEQIKEINLWVSLKTTFRDFNYLTTCLIAF